MFDRWTGYHYIYIINVSNHCPSDLLFCYIKLILNRKYFLSNTFLVGLQGHAMYPSSNPPIPQREILEADSLKKIILQVADLFDVRQIYTQPLDMI